MIAKTVVMRISLKNQLNCISRKIPATKSSLAKNEITNSWNNIKNFKPYEAMNMEIRWVNNNVLNQQISIRKFTKSNLNYNDFYGAIKQIIGS